MKMENEKPTYGILILAGKFIKSIGGEFEGEEPPKFGNHWAWKYMGINIADGSTLFQNHLPDMNYEIAEYVGLIHAMMYIRKNQSPLVAYSISDQAIQLVEEKKCVAYSTVRNAGCYMSVEKAHKWILFGSKQYFPWKWKSNEWGEPKEMLKIESK